MHKGFHWRSFADLQAITLLPAAFIGYQFEQSYLKNRNAETDYSTKAKFLKVPIALVLLTPGISIYVLYPWDNFWQACFFKQSLAGALTGFVPYAFTEPTYYLLFGSSKHKIK